MKKLSDVIGLLVEDYRFEKLHKHGFSNGLVAMMRAMEKGQDVGIITARSSKEGNQPIIALIERFTKNPIKYKFFVNDKTLSKSLTGSTTALKKLQILIEFRNGIGQAPKKYSKVKLFEDENLNLEAVQNREALIQELGFKKNIKLDNIKAYDIRLWDFDKLDSEIKPSKNTISFFDLDGTVIHTDAKIHIKDKSTNTILATLTQEEFAIHGKEKIQDMIKTNPNAYIDLSEFSHKRKIKKQVNLKTIKRKDETRAK